MSRAAPKSLARLVRGFFHDGLVKIGAETFSCQVTNMSATGATLHFKAPIELPERFALQLRHDGKVMRSCTVTWDEGAEIGVLFVREAI